MDAFGTTIPGLTITASAPATALPGSSLTYTFQVKNGAGTDAGSAAADFALPVGTTFYSQNGASCTTPAVGATGNVSCNLGTVPAGSGTSFQVTVQINAGATGSINNGDYTIRGAGLSPLIGPLVTTALAYPITASVVGGNGTISCPASAQSGQSAVCTITAAPGYSLTSLSLDGAVVKAGIVGNTYTLANISAAHTLMGTFGLSTYAITPSAPGGNGSISWQSPVLFGASSLCTLTPSPEFALSALSLDGSSVLGSVSGNSYVLSNVTAAHSVQAAFAPTSYIITTSVPGGNGSIACTGPVAHGANEDCTITPAAGYGLASLSDNGADVMGVVSNGKYTLTSVSTTHAVQATFALTTNVITEQVPGGHGTLRCSAPVIYGQGSVCQILPASGYRLRDLTLDGMDVRPQVEGNSLAIANVIGPHTLQGNFELIPMYRISVSILGGNGTITCDGPVAEGQNTSCTIAAEPGYELDALYLDGVDARILIQGQHLALYNVRTAHSLSGSFKKSIALACSSNAECHSGFCIDGVCCNRACNGQCESCNVSGQVSTCAPVEAGPPRNAHPSVSTSAPRAAA